MQKKNTELIYSYLDGFSAVFTVEETEQWLEDFFGKYNADDLLQLACYKRDSYWNSIVSYSPKVFLPITHLCRDVCHYCTFAKTPRHLTEPYMRLEAVLAQVHQAEKMGCKEALLTLGEKPELRYPLAEQWLQQHGFSSTIDYVAQVAKIITEQSSLLPHINAGNLSLAEYRQLKPVSASMGLMLESSSARLCTKGHAHYGSPDKDPKLRLSSIALAGEMQIPFTSGILLGIGETRTERIATLCALRDVHLQYGHLQEVIVQNFRAKPNTLMANVEEPSLAELQWTIAVARLLLPCDVSVQAPPNLSAKNLVALLQAGINDWGGVSPLTKDFVNPEAPWPSIQSLKQACAIQHKYLQPRLTVYPKYIHAASASEKSNFLEPAMHAKVLALVDSDYWAKQYTWKSGVSTTVDDSFKKDSAACFKSDNFLENVTLIVRNIFDKLEAKQLLNATDVEQLFAVRGADFVAVCKQADALRKKIKGDSVSYVLNRNINYTNICSFHCEFCAFSKGSKSWHGKEAAYVLELDEIVMRAKQAWDQGATEVCLQGGIHPRYTGQTYLDICSALRTALPHIHIHAFSPLEIYHGAQTLNIDVVEFLRRLKHAGLNTLPGTAAEILDDTVRDIICADKISSNQWLEIMRTAHHLGIRSTATIMFGHVERPVHWARHLLHIRNLQIETGGFTEFVPLPFVATQAPLFIRGKSRSGPDIREAVLMHAVARLVLSPWIENIQASWVKMGEEGVQLCLQAGANDLGGSLMNESITRAAGALHGQGKDAQTLQALAQKINRPTLQRNTLYQEILPTRVENAPLFDLLPYTELSSFKPN